MREQTEQPRRQGARPENARDPELDQYEHEAACAAFVQDAAAFMRWAFRNSHDNAIVSTLAHDIGGLSRRERCFLPRVSGYAAREIAAAIHARQDEIEEGGAV